MQRTSYEPNVFEERRNTPVALKRLHKRRMNKNMNPNTVSKVYPKSFVAGPQIGGISKVKNVHGLTSKGSSSLENKIDGLIKK